MKKHVKVSKNLSSRKVSKLAAKGKKRMDIISGRRRFVFYVSSSAEEKQVVTAVKHAVEAVNNPAPVPQNKHAITAKRPLTEQEQEVIRREFLKLNGIFEESKKDCTRIRNLLSDDVSVWQVSGYVVKLHQLAKAKELSMKDRRAYLSANRGHYKHWLSYNGAKYDEMREKSGVTLGKVMTLSARRPRFAVPATQVKETKPRHKVLA
jgi:hypothetical protein